MLSSVTSCAERSTFQHGWWIGGPDAHSKGLTLMSGAHNMGLRWSNALWRQYLGCDEELLRKRQVCGLQCIRQLVGTMQAYAGGPVATPKTSAAHQACDEDVGIVLERLSHLLVCGREATAVRAPDADIAAGQAEQVHFGSRRRRCSSTYLLRFEGPRGRQRDRSVPLTTARRTRSARSCRAH